MVLELAITIVMAIQNQLKIAGSSAYMVSGFGMNLFVKNVHRNLRKTPWVPTKNSKRPYHCPYCGNTWSLSHRHNFLALEKTFRKCGIRNQLAKYCLKPKGDNWNTQPRLYQMEDSPSDAATVGTTNDDLVNQIDSMLRQSNMYDANNYDSDLDELEDICVALV